MYKMFLLKLFNTVKKKGRSGQKVCHVDPKTDCFLRISRNPHVDPVTDRIPH